LLDDDKTLAREVRTYIQTDKYVGRKNDGTASHTTQRILRERYEENRERRQRLVRQLEQRCKESACCAAGQPLQTKAATAANAVADGLNYLVRNTFNKLGYLTQLSANPQAEIKAVLSATDVDDLGFSLEAGQGNLQAINEVVQHIELAAGANRQSVLEDLVQERFGRRPYGWPEWEVVLLVARLVRRGDISLVMDGGVLALDKAFEAITSPSKWRRITVVKRKTVDSGKLQEARNLAKDVLGNIAPDGEDALDAHLREQLGRWRSDLTSYKTLADTGNYPGGEPIADALGVINKLLAETESVGLIGKFLERRADLLDLSDDVHELRNFFEHQRQTWDKLRQAEARFQPNRNWLDQDDIAARALTRIQEILTAPAPYGLVKEAEGLIQTIEQVNQALVAKHRDQVRPAIDTQLAKVQVELDDAKADSDLRNQCLYPLQQLKTRIETQTSLAHIAQAATLAVELADDAFSKIEASSKVELPPGVEDKPVVKPRRVVQTAALVPKPYLETQEDVDAYLDKLRTALEKLIAAGDRIEIR